MGDFENELLVGLTPYIKAGTSEDVRLLVSRIAYKYDIKKAEHSLVVYEGDVNEAILQRFIMAKLAQGLSQNTLRYYRQCCERFFMEINKPYTQVSADDIRYYLALKIHQGWSKTTANNERRSISAFYGWLQKEEILLKNPMLKVDCLKETKKKKNAYDLRDLEKIRIACKNNREKAMVEILASTWCRISELVGIKLTEIEDGKVLIHGKGDKDRYCFLNARAMMALEVYMSERKDENPYLFPRAKYTVGGAPMYTTGKMRKRAGDWYMEPDMVADDGHMDKSSAEGVIRNIGKRASVTNCHPHRFRRTGATLALRSGMPITLVSKLLGHENIQTTQIYLDVSDEDLEQAHSKYVI